MHLTGEVFSQNTNWVLSKVVFSFDYYLHPCKRWLYLWFWHSSHPFPWTTVPQWPVRAQNLTQLFVWLFSPQRLKAKLTPVIPVLSSHTQKQDKKPAVIASAWLHHASSQISPQTLCLLPVFAILFQSYKWGWWRTLSDSLFSKAFKVSHSVVHTNNFCEEDKKESLREK